MTIAVEQTVLGGVTSGDSSSLASWTPGSNELILLFVAMRDETITPTASGNGITFTQIHDIDNVQNQGGLTVFRGMSASPSTGQITVTHTGSSLPVSCAAIRLSGIDTSGTNGSGAVGNTNSDTGPDPDDDDMTIAVTIDANDMAIFSGWHRNRTLSDPPGSDDTTISINNAFGSGGSTTHVSVWQDTGSGSVTGGQAANLSGDVDHCESALEINIAAGTQYNQSAAGTQTTSGAISKTAQLPQASTQASAGTVSKLTSITTAASQASSGAVATIKIVLQSIAGTQTSSGTVIKTAQLPQAGTQTSSGAVSRLTSITTAASQASSGAVATIKIALKSIAGTQTSSGDVSKQTSINLASAQASAGAIIRSTFRTLAGAMSSAGSILTELFEPSKPIIHLTLPARSTSFTLPTRSTSFTLPTRSTSFTLPTRSTSFTLPTRSTSFTLTDRS